MFQLQTATTTTDFDTYAAAREAQLAHPEREGSSIVESIAPWNGKPANEVKITGLSALQVTALGIAQVHGLVAELTKTTATFPTSATGAAMQLDEVKTKLAGLYGKRGHPVQSLHAVSRKLAKAAN